MNLRNIIQAIKLIYPEIQGGYQYWQTQHEGENDGQPWANPIDGLVWENSTYPKPTWVKIQSAVEAVEISSLKKNKINDIKTLRDSLNLAPMASHQGKELIPQQDGTFASGRNKYFIFDTRSTNNPATEPSSILLATALSGLSNPNFELRYSCTITENNVERKGYITITPALAGSIITHASLRNSMNIKLCNDKEAAINACATIAQLNTIDTTTLI